MLSSNSVPSLDHTRFYQPQSLKEVTHWVAARNAEGKTAARSDLNRRFLQRLEQDSLARDRTIAEGDLAPQEQASDSFRTWIRSSLYDPSLKFREELVPSDIPGGDKIRARSCVIRIH